MLVLHDVSELRRLETVRRDFVANVSHELRTPLTAIKGYAETLLGPAGDERDTALRFLEVIDRHSERLGRLIDDLLTLSDLEFGRTPLRRRPVARRARDRRRRADARRAAPRSAASRVDAEVAPATPPVARRRRSAAAGADQPGRQRASSTRRTAARVHDRRRPATLAGDAAVELAVVDTGIGIPSQDLPRLTERFFRVDKARSRELGGTGLGLAIVKHIVQAHGGRLAIESTLGQGTTVRVTLPGGADAMTPADAA